MFSKSYSSLWWRYSSFLEIQKKYLTVKRTVQNFTLAGSFYHNNHGTQSLWASFLRNCLKKNLWRERSRYRVWKLDYVLCVLLWRWRKTADKWGPQVIQPHDLPCSSRGQSPTATSQRQWVFPSSLKAATVNAVLLPVSISPLEMEPVAFYCDFVGLILLRKCCRAALLVLESLIHLAHSKMYLKIIQEWFMAQTRPSTFQ